MEDNDISVDFLQESWGFAFSDKIEKVLIMNSFGNLLVQSGGMVYRILPEDSSVEIVCALEDFQSRLSDVDFLESWKMEVWEKPIVQHYGVLPQGKVIAFKLPRSLGGKEEFANIYFASPRDYIGGMGQIARQISDLPDGAQVQLKAE